MTDERTVEDDNGVDSVEPDAAAPRDAFGGPEWTRKGTITASGRVRVRRRTRRNRRRRRRILLGLAVLAFAVVAALAWLVYTGARARTELEAARAGVRALRADVAAGDLPAARSDAASLRAHADKAYDLTSGPLWASAAAIPYFGDPLDTTRAVTSSIHSIADGALPALVHAADTLGANSLRKPDGSIDLAAITAIVPELNAATQVVSHATSTIASSSGGTWLGSVNSARTSLLAELGKLTRSVQSADTAVNVAPPLLGATGPKSYMVTFENDAELRGTAGLPGAFAIMHADRGKISFTRFEPDNELAGVTSGLDLGRGFNQLWKADPTGSYVNSNQSPHFPYAARIWTAMWQRKSGQQLDGAIALDPTTLSYLLAVTGPAVLPDHTQVSAANVVALTQRDVYSRFAHDNDARKQFLLDIARAVSHRLIDSRPDPTALLKAAGKAAAESRLLMWTRDAQVESRLEPYSISGSVPDLSVPYAGLTIVNGGGDKLSYYLHASFVWRRTGCGDVRNVTATVTLRNDAPRHGLPSYVTDVNSPTIAPGVQRVNVVYYASTGAQLLGVTHNGKPMTVASGTERGHPVTVFGYDLPIASAQTFELHFSEPAGTTAPVIRVQPMVNPMDVSVENAPCGS